MYQPLSSPNGATAEDSAAQETQEFRGAAAGGARKSRWLAHGRGWAGGEPGAPSASLPGETPRHFGGLLGSTRVAGSAGSKSIQARAPARAADASAGQTIPILPPGPGIRSVPAAAQQLPTHTTHTLTHTHTRTQPLLAGEAPRSPQQTARLQRGRRSGQPGESRRSRFQQPDSCRRSPPGGQKNKVNFKVMQIVMQRFSPPYTLRLKKKKIASHNWRKN